MVAGPNQLPGMGEGALEENTQVSPELKRSLDDLTAALKELKAGKESVTVSDELRLAVDRSLDASGHVIKAFVKAQAPSLGPAQALAEKLGGIASEKVKEALKQFGFALSPSVEQMEKDEVLKKVEEVHARVMDQFDKLPADGSVS